MILLLVSTALAGDVVAIPDGQVVNVPGPAVAMSEERFTQFLVAEKQLPICKEALDKSVDQTLLASKRAAEAFDIAKAQFDSDEMLVAQKDAQLAEMAAKGVKLERKASRFREQRNVAVAVSAGFIAASAATALLLMEN